MRYYRVFSALLSSSALILWLGAVTAHNRLECPPSRSAATGAKVGPCDLPDNPNIPAFPLQPNALNTVTWLESISHPGAPARFSLSLDGNDNNDVEGFESCILLDHVPHDEYSRPSFRDPSSYHRTSITLWIPDVYCERCSLQLVTFMTDIQHGVAPLTHCVYTGTKSAGTLANDTESLPICPTVYHSCATVSINGTIPRNAIETCNTTDFEENLQWPFSENERGYSTYYDRGNPGLYNPIFAQLEKGGAPLTNCATGIYCTPDEYFETTVQVPPDAPYTQWQGMCASVVGTRVENFVPGKLPDIPKDLSQPFPPGFDPCTQCLLIEACFDAALCSTRDLSTGLWPNSNNDNCNSLGPFCESKGCFADSPCYLGPNTTTATTTTTPSTMAPSWPSTETPSTQPAMASSSTRTPVSSASAACSLFAMLIMATIFWL